MGTSIGKVIDYYVDVFTRGITGATPIPALSSIEPTVEVADYFPTTAGGTYVIVGRTGGDQAETADTALEYVELGAGRIQEAYAVTGLVTVVRDGPKASAARNPCLALHDGVVRLVHADPTCGGVLKHGQYAYLSRAVFDQADPSPKDGSVMASMQFWITVSNRYIP